MFHDSESWRVVPSLRVYEASSFGNIRRVVPETSVKFGVHLKGRPNNCGYLYISTSVDGKTRSKYIHRLVAEAFYGPCPDGHVVDHKDTNKLNNRSDNLQYITQRASGQQAMQMGFLKNAKKGEAHPFAILTTADVQQMRQLREQGWSYNKLAKKFGKHPSHIRDVCIGRIWAHVK